MIYDELLRRIDDRLAKVGLSERKACLNAGLSVDAIRTIRHRGNAPKIATLTALAAVLGVSADYLISAAGSLEDAPKSGPIQLDRVFVRGYVQGGAWREAIEWEGHEWYAITALADDRFPGSERFGLEVRGTSMDKLYPPGTIVICVRFGDLGRSPESGERVICLRRDAETNGYEATIKEYQRDPAGRHVLWPRSNDPAFQQPFVLAPSELAVSADYEPMPTIAHARSYDDGAEPDIVVSALVIQSVRRE